MRRKSIDPVLALAKQVELAEKEGQYLSRTVRKGHFQYSGNQTRFVERVNALTDKERRDIVEASIILTGNKVKPENKCCYYATLLLGVVFVVPLFFMCCSWWQRMAYPAYEVDVESYQLLAKLLLSTDASGLSLTVYDNAFGR